MKAIAIVPGTKDIHLIDTAEPKIEFPDQLKIKVRHVGICGTDREEASSQRADLPVGETKLIIGHEMMGEVVEVGKEVKRFKKGDLVAITVRRGCAKCPTCLSDRADLCYSSNYRERGIKGLHGFQSEYVVDSQFFAVKIPPFLASCAVLCEPTSIIEKAIEEALLLQRARLPDWNDLENKQALVVGLGPIGLLACIALRLRGFKVLGLDREADSNRTEILQQIGAIFLDAKSIKPKEISIHYGQIDMIIEAVGLAELDLQLLAALGPNGICVLTGVPRPGVIFSMDSGHIIRDFVLNNKLLLGSVNASKKHWELAISDLEKAEMKWKGAVQKLITSHIPYQQYADAFIRKHPKEIKSVIDWTK